MSEKRICPYPFSRTNIGRVKYAPCCIAWFTDEYSALDHSGDIWNSQAAIELRKSILDGSFKYCNRDVCKYPLTDIIEVDHIDENEVYIDEESIKKMREGDYEYHYPMTSVVFEGDTRCNLACPSCRTGRITKISKKAEFGLYYLSRKVKKIIGTIRKVKFGGCSEFFFSDFYINMLKLLAEKKPPHLKELSILTNGTLLNEKMYQSLGEGKDLITEINVSMDAGDEDTYQVVRGGSWKHLMANLAFLQRLREKGTLKSLKLNFVVYEDNLQSIENFIKLGEKFNVDTLIVTDLLPWDMMKLNYKEKAIHLPSHPKHDEYKKIKQNAINHPLVWWPNE